MTDDISYIGEEEGLHEGRVTTYITHKRSLHEHQGNIIGVLGVSINITEQKRAQAEAAEEKAKAKAEAEIRQAVMIFSGNIAHDLRTPLTVIAEGTHTLEEYIHYLLEGCAAAEKAGLIKPPNRVIKAKVLTETFSRNIEYANKMQNYINDSLKTLKQLVLGKLEKEDLMICEIWRCLNGFMSHYPFENSLERAKVHCSDKCAYSFMGNEALFERILSNLVKNALYQIKKNERGEIFITTEEGSDYNLLRVKDTAGGAPPKVVETIFEGYRTTKAEGTGVGLGFCKLTMQSFGGDITCHSVEGDYMEFVLSFPKLSLEKPSSDVA